MRLVLRCLQIVWEVQYELPFEKAQHTKLKFWALENPAGFLKFFLGNPSLEFNPFDFGDDCRKKPIFGEILNNQKRTPFIARLVNSTKDFCMNFPNSPKVLFMIVGADWIKGRYGEA